MRREIAETLEPGVEYLVANFLGFIAQFTHKILNSNAFVFMSSFIQTLLPVPMLPCMNLNAVKQKAAVGWHWCVKVLDKHTDLISSVGILAITTCLFAAKIYSSIPSIIPRLSRFVLNFGGIIWLNVEVRDFRKSCRDFYLATGIRDLQGLVVTAAKVFVKASDILLTCGMFLASAVALGGFPQMTAGMYLAMRPIAIVSLGMRIATEVYDYFANEKLLQMLRRISQLSHQYSLRQGIMRCFFECLYLSRKTDILSLFPKKVKKLSVKLLRQLDLATLETFRENLSKNIREDPYRKNLKLFYSLKESMQNKQAMTQANLSLIALGYFSMGICRIFPDTLLEMGFRWGMSVLYTDELLRQKFFQADLACEISSP
jgi:hypothetical protein